MEASICRESGVHTIHEQKEIIFLAFLKEIFVSFLCQKVAESVK
jgi:hypothetical protein